MPEEQNQKPKNYTPSYNLPPEKQDPLDRISCPEPLHRISTTQDPLDQWISRRFNHPSHRQHHQHRPRRKYR